jgi:hypothetical protein
MGVQVPATAYAGAGGVIAISGGVAAWKGRRAAGSVGDAISRFKLPQAASDTIASGQQVVNESGLIFQQVDQALHEPVQLPGRGVLGSVARYVPGGSAVTEATDLSARMPKILDTLANSGLQAKITNLQGQLGALGEATSHDRAELSALATRLTHSSVLMAAGGAAALLGTGIVLQGVFSPK